MIITAEKIITDNSVLYTKERIERLTEKESQLDVDKKIVLISTVGKKSKWICYECGNIMTSRDGYEKKRCARCGYRTDSEEIENRKYQRSKEILIEKVCNSSYTIVSFDDKKQKATIMCDKGHKVTKKTGAFGVDFFTLKCRKCYDTDLLNSSIEKIKNKCLENNGKWIGGRYTGINCTIKLKCQNGHEWETRAGNILDGKWCPKCAKEYIAKHTTAAAYFKRINQEIEYYRSRQNVFDDINRKIRYAHNHKKKVKTEEEILEQKKQVANKFRERYKTDVCFRLNELIKSQMKKCLVKDRTMGKYYYLLGYDTKELKEHLESKFKDGMSWGNIGKWHIDHIKPKSWFKLKNSDGTINEDEVIKCWSLENLQPMWGRENIRKGDRWEG